MERVTPQHPVRRLAARFKPINEVPTTHAAKAFAVAAVEDDRVARLYGQAQWRRRLWRRLGGSLERPRHWLGVRCTGGALLGVSRAGSDP